MALNLPKKVKTKVKARSILSRAAIANSGRVMRVTLAPKGPRGAGGFYSSEGDLAEAIKAARARLERPELKSFMAAHVKAVREMVKQGDPVPMGQSNGLPTPVGVRESDDRSRRVAPTTT